MNRLLRALLVLWLLAWPNLASASDPLAAAILNFEGAGVDDEMTETLSTIVRNEAMQVEKYQVVNQFPIKLSDILLVLGCSAESPSCLRQVADETNARVLIFGSVEKTATSYRLELSIFDSGAGRMLNTLSRTVTDAADPIVAFRQEIETFFAEERGEARTRLQIGSSVNGARIFIDDTFVGVAPLERKGLPPGNYRIRVTHPGTTDWEETVQLKPGGDQEVWAELSREPQAVASAPPDTTSSTSTTEVVVTTSDGGPVERVPTRNWGAWSAIVVGGVSLATSVALGTAVETTERKVERESADGTLTESRYQELAQRGQNFELAHFVLLGVGAVAVTTGIVWLLLSDSDDVATVELGVGPGTVSTRIRF